MTDPSQDAHKASDLPLAERLDYLRVLSALTSQDGTVAGRELGALDEFCDSLGLSELQRRDVMIFARNPDPAAVRATCERMRSSHLRFTLVTDLLYIAYTDDEYTEDEREIIEGIATLLDIDRRQLEAMERYATQMLRNRVSNLPARPDGDEDDVVGANLAGTLAGAGVPIAAVAAAGAGFSGASMATGLAALGGAFGLGVGAGVGLAAGMGVASFVAVRNLYGWLRD